MPDDGTSTETLGFVQGPTPSTDGLAGTIMLIGNPKDPPMHSTRTPYLIVGGWTLAGFAYVGLATIAEYLNPPAGCGGWGFFCSTDPSEAAFYAFIFAAIITAIILVPTIVIVLLAERRDHRHLNLQIWLAGLSPVVLMMAWLIFRAVAT